MGLNFLLRLSLYVVFIVGIFATCLTALRHVSFSAAVWLLLIFELAKPFYQSY